MTRLLWLSPVPTPFYAFNYSPNVPSSVSSVPGPVQDGGDGLINQVTFPDLMKPIFYYGLDPECSAKVSCSEAGFGGSDWIMTALAPLVD